MPTTFNVISIDVLPDMDTVEGNNLSENAAALVGMTFGGVADPLVNDFAEWSEVGDVGSSYDHDNSPNDQFSINGGAPQTYDGTAVYNATVTYVDGSTDTITAVVAQDTNGNTYIMPEFSANADQAVLEAEPIQSISFNSLQSAQWNGTTANRQAWDFAVCFTRGTRIETDRGAVRVEDLTEGDRIRTADNGYQPLRWVGQKRVAASGALAPVRISAGALGNHADLFVSPQHRMLVTGWRAELFAGETEVLIAAKHLVNGKTITRQIGGMVDYFHLLFDRHEIVFAEGAASESFHPGQQGWSALDQAARQEILELFPELDDHGPGAYGPAARLSLKAREARAVAH